MPPRLPITDPRDLRLDRLLRCVLGSRLTAVSYHSSMGPVWPDGLADGPDHEVDADVFIQTDAGCTIVVSWAMYGLVEGLDLLVARGDEESLSGYVSRSDVSHTPAWRDVLGRVIEEVGAAWHGPNDGTPDTLWSLRFSFAGGASVVIALGEFVGTRLSYIPDALVVLFSEDRARAYTLPDSHEDSFGPPLLLLSGVTEAPDGAQVDVRDERAGGNGACS